MKRIIKSLIVILAIIIISPSVLQAQMTGLHGDDREWRVGLHDGNQFRISFFNDGTFGGQMKKGYYGGEWPINSGHYYLLDGNIYVIAEVADNVGATKGTLRHIQATVKSLEYEDITTGDKDPSGVWWTFLPLPGFANPSRNKVAMVKGGVEWSDSWPAYWPDKDTASDPGWRNDNEDKNSSKAAWNGYFGKNVFNADQESYFVADDYAKQEFPNFRPDTTDLSRGGLGMRMYVRGFQWSKPTVEDALFTLFDLQNIGTYNHKKVVFGFKVGNNMGETSSGPDASGDDGGSFNKDLDLAWTWDNNNIGASDWGPGGVGVFGGTFLESPGNPFDGIDNDNDGKNGSGDNISEDMFKPVTLNLNDQIVTY